MVSLLPTKFHEIMFSSFRGVALINCVTDRWTDRRTGQKQYVFPPKWGRHNYLLVLVLTADVVTILSMYFSSIESLSLPSYQTSSVCRVISDAAVLL
jgi:hypothetical protein